MSRKTICDNCNKVALNGVEQGWIVLSGWSNNVSDPYISVGIVTKKDEYELVPYAGLDFCSLKCIYDWFYGLYGSIRMKVKE